MLKQEIPFTDYNGNERVVTEYFHLNEAEIVDIQAKSINGIQADMQDAILSNDASRVLDFIKDLVHRSYGKKSLDGVNFDKNEELLQKFITSAYYSDFLLGLIQDNGAKGQQFVQGIMPAKLVERALKQVQGQDAGPADRKEYAPSAREIFDAAQAEKANVTVPQNPIASGFGQPDYPRIQNTPVVQENVSPIQTVQNAPDAEEFAAFRAWQQSQRQQATESAPASPDAFRVREPEPDYSLPRPPHEQSG